MNAVKNNWSDRDFEEMTWHDNYIYAISFPDERQAFILDIDYIFDWILEPNSGNYSFWISPCKLVFLDVLHLKINLDFSNTVGLFKISVVKMNAD